MCLIHYWKFVWSVGHILDVYSSGTSDGPGLVEEEEPPSWEKLMFSVEDEREVKCCQLVQARSRYEHLVPEVWQEPPLSFEFDCSFQF